MTDNAIILIPIITVPKKSLSHSKSKAFTSPKPTPPELSSPLRLVSPQSGSQSARPLILVCNDDGIDAPGIEALALALQKLGEVTVVAPATHQSGMSHAMTLGKPMRVSPYYKMTGRGAQKLFGYSVSGTPVDCMKMALTHVLPRKPDLVVSGINYGSNTAINILYSGTVGAAIEAAIFGIPAIAVSLTAYENADFTYAAKFARKLSAEVLRHGLPPETILTVNVPNLPEAEIKGVSVTHQGKSKWGEKMIERHDAYGHPYYWLHGEMNLLDKGVEADEYAIREGYVSVTPLRYDLTHHDFLKTVSTWNLKK